MYEGGPWAATAARCRLPVPWAAAPSSGKAKSRVAWRSSRRLALRACEGAAQEGKRYARVTALYPDTAPGSDPSRPPGCGVGRAVHPALQHLHPRFRQPCPARCRDFAAAVRHGDDQGDRVRFRHRCSLLRHLLPAMEEDPTTGGDHHCAREDSPSGGKKTRCGDVCGEGGARPEQPAHGAFGDRRESSRIEKETTRRCSRCASTSMSASADSVIFPGVSLRPSVVSYQRRMKMST